MELENNVIFNEDMLYEDTLHCVNMMNNEKDLEKEAKKILNKINSNTFALLLRRGMKCKIKDDIVYMKINDNVYECDNQLIKNTLFKDYDEIINKCLITD